MAVNEKDQQLRMVDKNKAHHGKGILHRAFSVWITDRKGRILIQKRSQNKLLWPFFWSNSCCGHPQKGESYVCAGERRLKEELGFTCRLKPLFKFYYQASYKDIGAENEICAVLLGQYSGQKIKPEPKEASEIKWAKYNALINQIKEGRGFTPWFKKIIQDRRLKSAITRAVY